MDPTHTPDQPIGIFDSGVGGLTVMRAVADLLPGEDILYLGDTARVPYGNRAPETVRRYALNCTRLLVDRGVKALVVACNTASAYALEAIQDRYPIPVLGVIGPVARTACQTTRTDHIAVIGTRGTVRSMSYPQAIGRLRPEVAVHQTPCPLFAPLAEEGWTRGPVLEEVARSYLEALRGSQADTLILGCTHYPILREALARVVESVVGRPMTLLNSSTSTAEALRELLVERDLLGSRSAGGRFEFLVTDLPEGFAPTAQRFFGADITDFEHVDIVDTGS